ncbi:MAG: RagB/SusD family nutrient uptake outer membrane protein [Cytophagales bacterium]|nr:RagB/SusD family nutrient uptake outer membrane protein [Cytophagales bacterium]
MNNYKKKSVSVIVLIFWLGMGLFSCESVLEVDSENVVKESEFYTYTGDLYSIEYGIYKEMQDIAESYVVLTELRADLVNATDQAPSYIKDIQNVQVSGDNPVLKRKEFYDVIFACNRLLKAIPQVKEKDKGGELTEELESRFKTLGLTIRSWTYFTLARLYGDGILYTEALPDDFTGQEPKMTQLELIKKLQSDFLAQKQLLSQFSTPAGSPILLLADLYLWEGNYAKAEALYGGIIRTSEYKVGNQFEKEKWKNIFTESLGDNHSEVDFAAQFFKKEYQQHTLQSMCETDYWLKPSAGIIENWKSQIQRDEKKIDIFRGENVSYTGGAQPKINKYSLKKKPGDNDATIIFTRGAGLHLKWAETLNRLGKFEAALALLNGGYETETPLFVGNIGIRRRAGLKDLTLDFSYLPEGAVAAPQDSLIQIENAIINERALELAFEGGRWFDLMRIAKRRDDPSFLADKVAAKFPEAEQEAIKTLLKDEKNWYLPWE